MEFSGMIQIGLDQQATKYSIGVCTKEVEDLDLAPLSLRGFKPTSSTLKSVLTSRLGNRQLLKMGQRATKDKRIIRQSKQEEI